MERRERYDPEDIEHLLQERSFDDLLDEERAYVLRHLGSREEYEAMRRLMAQVREHEGDQPALSPPAEVREHVLAAFRAEQRPQWRIWLNSVGLLFWPDEMRVRWRAVLAIASVAALIATGAWFVHDGSGAGKRSELAEARQASTQPAAAGDAAAPADSAPSAATGANETRPATPIRVPPAPPAINDAPSEAEASSAERNEGTIGLHADDMATAAEDARPEQTKEAEAAPTSRVVTASELLMNQSVANATGSATASMKKEGKAKQRPGGGNLAEAPELMTLLATGW